MNILVLAGGLSLERNVSLSSGSLISAALRRRGHKVLLIDVYEGAVIDAKDPYKMFTLEQGEEYIVSELIPDLEEVKKKNGGREELIGKNVLELCRIADVVYIALHGAMGENGQLQATLDNFGIKYTGSGYVGSLLAMDKDIAKKLFVGAKIPTPAWVYCKACESDAEKIASEVGFPCVIKPVTGGSSVGVSFANNKEELERAIAAAEVYEENLLIEKMILGREFTCGILGGRVLPPVEIIPKEGFYDYKNKYQKGATTEICPAHISEAQLERISEQTRRAFDALRLSGYARFDFIMDENGVFWCLEANTLPGMTPTSLLPQEAAAVGIEYDELCEIIATMGYNK